jgi:hypothetical protein
MIVIPDSFLHRINGISRTSASVRLKDSKLDCDPDYDTLSYLFSPPSLPASASLFIGSEMAFTPLDDQNHILLEDILIGWFR